MSPGRRGCRRTPSGGAKRGEAGGVNQLLKEEPSKDFVEQLRGKGHEPVVPSHRRDAAAGPGGGTRSHHVFPFQRRGLGGVGRFKARFAPPNPVRQKGKHGEIEFLLFLQDPQPLHAGGRARQAHVPSPGVAQQDPCSL
jgi:hypothetical protein